MKNSRILLSAITAGILCSVSFGGVAATGGKEVNLLFITNYYGTNNHMESGQVTANGGNITITDGSKTYNSIYAGFSGVAYDKTFNENEDVYYNYLEVTGGETTIIYGGFSNSTGKVYNNTVEISGEKTVINNVYGGYKLDGVVEKNIVIVSNGKANAVYGGYVNNSNGSATENVVVYKGGEITDIYGGHSSYPITSSQNQLIIAGKSLKASSIKSFQEYFFALPADVKANDTMLTLTNQLTFNPNDKIGVATQGTLTNLKAGEKVTLINNVSGFDTKMYDKNLEMKYKDDKLLIDTSYNFELSQDENKLNAKLLAEEKKSSEESKALSEGTAGGAAAIIEGGSVMADKGISSAMAQSNNKANIGAGKTTDNFGAVGFGNSRYQTGSYVDSKSINISVGVALGQEVKYGKVLVGPFIELGYSDYETHNDFSTGHVRGDGISKYLGGGVFARYDWNSYASGHPYVEGSIRFGRNKNSFDSTDMGQSYKSNAFYYGAHLGLGYIVEFQNNSNLDFYAKYFYTHLNSDDVTTNQGAQLNLDAVNSHKTRFGARYNHALNNSSEWQIKPYVGLAWEHEYKGAANATTSGYAIEAPSLEGSSGLAEIGVTIGKEKGLSADLGVAGYAGKRRGVAGNIMVKYEF